MATPKKGRLVIVPATETFARRAADSLAEALRESLAAGGRASLALSGGNTPRDAYALLARAPGIDWAKVDVFWVDERAVAPTDDRSNYHHARASLLDVAPLPAECVHRMPADRPDLAAAARDYADVLRKAVPPGPEGVPVLDVVVLGVGDDGHTASMFPGEATIDVEDASVAAVPARAPSREARLTLTRPLLQHARRVLVLVAGAGKRPALERTWAPDGDLHATPARLVNGCRGAVTWLVDAAAAG